MSASRSSRSYLGTVFVLLLVATGAILGIGGTTSAGEQAGTAQAAFDRLKALEGTWQGTTPGDGETVEPVIHVFKVSAAGTVVMETMNPQSPDHEMINMYHLDGEELVLTHYCAGGNQPTMQLARPPAAANEMRFDFTGGTNLDPAKDSHIHAARLVITGDTLESSWTGYNEGKEAGVTTFVLKRGE